MSLADTHLDDVKSPEEEKPRGIDAFPSLDSPAPTSEVRVTGFAGLGEDEDREKFESAFPDLSGEVPQEAVSLLVMPEEEREIQDKTEWKLIPRFKNQSTTP
jgi:hypothetical protein